MYTKSWKVTVVGLILLTIMVLACISIQAGSVTPNNDTSTESSTPTTETSNSPSTTPSVPEESIPETSTPEESKPEESEPEEFLPETSIPGIIPPAMSPGRPLPDLPPKPAIPESQPDIITDIQVKFYNDHQEGFNPVDGRQYLEDIATLLQKHAPEGLRISCGCAMSYTEGGSGKKGVYSRTNNCFGIRATPGWEGWVFARSTQTVYKDYATAVSYGASDFFRAYPTMEDSVIDYIRHMTNNRYNAVLTMDNNKDYLNHIVDQGYGEKHLAADWLWLIDYYDLDQYNIDWNATEQPAE